MTKLADIVQKLKELAGSDWLPDLYSQKVRSLRTRSYQLGASSRPGNIEILFTLLGIELKIGRKRLACPDLSTARYLRVFARIGCEEVAVPYDISQISYIADELDASWHRTMLLLDNFTETAEPRILTRIRSAVIKKIRDEIADIGPGEKMPEFNRSTKQRKT